MREVIRAGAYDYFVESGSTDELRIVLRRAGDYQELRRELQRLHAAPHPVTDMDLVVGTDESMVALFNFARKIAASDATVLITGETGTGKELLARTGRNWGIVSRAASKVAAGVAGTQL